METTLTNTLSDHISSLNNTLDAILENNGMIWTPACEALHADILKGSCEHTARLKAAKAKLPTFSEAHLTSALLNAGQTLNEHDIDYDDVRYTAEFWELVVASAQSLKDCEHMQ